MSFIRMESNVRNHKNETRLEIPERQNFYAREKKNDESIENFITDLKEMANFCNFGKQTERMIRDMVIQKAIKDEALLKLIMEKKELNLDNLKHMYKVFEIASKTKELAEKNVPNEPKFEKIYTKANSFDKPCWRCKQKHDLGKCSGLKCNYCKELGHYAKHCPKITEKRNNYSRSSKYDFDCKSYSEGRQYLHSVPLINIEKQTSSTANFTSRDPFSPIASVINQPSAPPAALMDFSIEEDFKIKSEFEKSKYGKTNDQVPQDSSATIYPTLTSNDSTKFVLPQESQNNSQSNVRGGISQSGQQNYKEKSVKKKVMSNSKCVIG